MAANPTADCDYHLLWAVGAYAAVVLLQGAQAYGRRPGLVRWVKANPAAVRAGGGRARAGVRAGVKVGVRAGARAKASARDSNSNSSDSL